MIDECPNCGKELGEAQKDSDLLKCLYCDCYYDPDEEGVYIRLVNERGHEAVWGVMRGEQRRLISASVDDTPETVWQHVFHHKTAK